MDYINSFLPTIESLGGFGYWVVFLIAFGESLAFIGTIIPGSVLIYMAGFLSSQGYLNIVSLIWFVTAGAACGDGLSYFLGTKGKQFFRNENKFLKLSHLEKGEEFFGKHGPKSVFLGRFIGPIRSIIPFIAGLSRMNKTTFFAWNISSAFLWAVSHLLVGYFFGSAIGIIETWTTRAGLIIVSIALVLGILWVILKTSGPFIAFLKSFVASAQGRFSSLVFVKRFTENNPTLARFVTERFSVETFAGRPLTLLVVAFVCVFFLFYGSVGSALSSGAIALYDEKVASLLFSFRDLDLVRFFAIVSLLAKWQIVFTLAVVVTLILRLWRKEFYIPAMWTVIGGAELFRFLGGLAFYRQRPEVSFYAINNSSFPSGHAVLAMAFYGFLIYVLARNSKTWGRKANILFFGSTIILGIGFAALYLGESFLSDVWGGYLLGLLWLMIGVSFAELFKSRKEIAVEAVPGVNTINFSVVLFAVWVVFYAGFSLNYKPSLNATVENDSVFKLAEASAVFKDGKMSRFSEKLLGNGTQPVNFVIVAKSDEKLITSVNKSGWILADGINAGTLSELIKDEFTNKFYASAPITPSFWNGKINNFGFEKPTEAINAYSRHNLRIWDTSFETPDGKVYVGTVRLDTVKLILFHGTNPDVDSERDLLFSDLTKAGVVAKSKKFQLTEPVAANRDLSETPFSTDGNAYEIILK